VSASNVIDGKIPFNGDERMLFIGLSEVAEPDALGHLKALYRQALTLQLVSTR